MRRSIVLAVCFFLGSLSPARSASPPVQAIPLVNPGFEEASRLLKH